MAQMFGGKKILNMRHLEPGDKEYDEKEAKVSIVCASEEDSKEQVVKLSEVKSNSPPPATEVAPAEQHNTHGPHKNDEDEHKAAPKHDLGSRGRK